MPRKKGLKRSQTYSMWERRRKVERYMRRGYTSQREIAAALGVSATQIHYDMQAIWSTWVEEQPQTRKERLQHRIKQLEHLIQESWNAWERSKKPEEGDNTLSKDCPVCHGVEPDVEDLDDDAPQPEPCVRCGGTGLIQEVRTFKKGQSGDPAYLAIIKEAIKECGRLEGLYVKRVAAKVTGHTTSLQVVADGRFKDTSDTLLLEARASIQRLYAAANTLDSTFVRDESKGKEAS